MNEGPTKINDLRRYWIVCGLEESLPYKQASNTDKKIVMQTYGFNRYVLQLRIEELRKEILDSISPIYKRIYLFVEKCLWRGRLDR